MYSAATLMLIYVNEIRPRHSLSSSLISSAGRDKASRVVRCLQNASRVTSAFTMPIVLYQLPASPPCRAVLMTADHLGLEVVTRQVDLLAGEHNKPEFLAINPQHCVPTIDDDGFILWESRAILSYLVNRYAPDSPLYPRDPKARANVDRMLHFELGNLFQAMKEFYMPQTYFGMPLDPEKEAAFKKSLAILEQLLEKTTYVAANHLTIADYSLLASLTFVEDLLDYSYGEFPKVSAWLKRMKKETPKYKEINELPVQQFKQYLKSKNFKLDLPR